MTEQQFIKIAKDLKLAYKQDSFLSDKDTLDLWFRFLHGIDAMVVQEAVDEYIAASKYPPTIADIRNSCEIIIDRSSGYRMQMREIFDFAKGVYPSSKINKQTMAYWNKLTADKNWSMRVEKAQKLSSEIATYVRDAEINGQINEIPSFTEYLGMLSNEL